MPNVRYLTGFTGSSGCVLLTPRKRIFFTDFRYRGQAAREVRAFEIRIIEGGLLQGVCRYASRRLRLKQLAVEYGGLSHEGYLLLRREMRGIRLIDARGLVEAMRLIKSRQEIDWIHRAAAIADKAFGRLRRHRVTGRTELEVAWMLEAMMREEGSGPMPFEIIVASGPRSAMPHGVAGNRTIMPNEPLVIDMGASISGYCCDITRTFATGNLKSRQQQIYRIVNEAQELAIAAAKPGTACAEVDGAARLYISKAGYGDAFGHSLGHGVGLEAHEGPVLSSRSEDVLAKGMTVTIEPGIYTGRTGVRIEDTVLIEATGAKPLTASPRDLIALK